ncbi:hypothetical protein GCM10010918_17650 [Paenibacillus radicis (ex Gao et al. 2016)]|uniref:Uncharacterized protein n=1 Tax=Paenibacillus radicis (ex Gao et al. 2016) TaxID=1737354 RepID=A0A917H1C7_9BACL|nr:hypothetical protein GCM10010918_17650 [Paenibacillus radicis (ex Gao et al. 2016)]
MSPAGLFLSLLEKQLRYNVERLGGRGCKANGDEGEFGQPLRRYFYQQTNGWR